VYRLVNGAYVLQSGEPFWMPEVELSIGRGDLPGLGTRWLYWYDQGNRLPSLEEQTALTEQELEHERQRTEQASSNSNMNGSGRNRSDAREELLLDARAGESTSMTSKYRFCADFQPIPSAA